LIRFLLDTNICIQIIRGRGSRALERLSRLDVGEAGISSITLAELCHGAAKSTDPPRNAFLIMEFCAALFIAPFDAKAADRYGRVRAELERAGTPTGPLGTLIAAHAMSLGVPLVTANKQEFRRVANLRVENWLHA
jgi:tRNA(fMet)-specific endonuclease VapC